MTADTMDMTLELPDVDAHVSVGDLFLWGCCVKLICDKHSIPYVEPKGTHYLRVFLLTSQRLHKRELGLSSLWVLHTLARCIRSTDLTITTVRREW
jgi:hypothetical protein